MSPSTRTPQGGCEPNIPPLGPENLYTDQCGEGTNQFAGVWMDSCREQCVGWKVLVAPEDVNQQVFKSESNINIGFSKKKSRTCLLEPGMMR